MSPHLGPSISAFIDDQLTPHERDGALNHIASCSLCASLVREERIARGLLHQCTDPTPSDGLMAGLLQLAPCESTNPTDAPSRRKPDPFVPCTALSTHAWSGTVRSPSRAWFAIAGSILALGVLSPIVMWSMDESQLVTPLTDQRAVHDHINELVDDPNFAPIAELSEPSRALEPEQVSQWAQSAGWIAPMITQSDSTVTIDRVGFSSTAPTHLEIVLRAGDTRALIRQTRGTLDRGALGDAEHVMVNGVPRTMMSTDPIHVVWQSDSTVFELIAPRDTATAMDMVALFPASEPHQGLSSVVTALSDFVGGAR